MKKWQMMVAAPSSGSGKTLVTCGLLRVLDRKGLNPCSFKTGPDYIDPMFHRSVLGLSSYNLDAVLSSEEFVVNHFHRESAGHQAAVVEGVMGLYDGKGGTTDYGSAWHIAHLLNLPIILVVNPKGSSLTLAAQLNGLQSFREDSHIRAIVLNRCSAMLAKFLIPMIEKETEIPVVGAIPALDELSVPSRHLGLFQAGEVENLQSKADRLADVMDESIDWEKMETLFTTDVEEGEPASKNQQIRDVTIAIAQDEAFTFVYSETIDTLTRAGAKLIPFSPLNDSALPEEANALYLPGGYPELYAPELKANTAMRSAIRGAISSGIPTVAECGGFMYLGKAVEADGEEVELTGVLPIVTRNAGRLVNFGYATLHAQEDSLLFEKDEEILIHEFHYFRADEDGKAFTMSKPGKRSWTGGFSTKTLYAGYPHLYFAAMPKAVKRFLEAAEEYGKKREL